MPSLLESLACAGRRGEVLIVENIVAEEDRPFQPQADLRARRIRIEDWPFEPMRDRLMFAMRGVKGKTGTFRAFAAVKGIARHNFGVLLSPLVTVASTAQLGPGCYAEPQVVIAPYARLGFAVTVNRGVTIGHHTTIGDFVNINPGCHVAGHCEIGERVTLGMGTLVFDHIKIGAGAVIGGGSVVNKDVPAGVLAFGNPCKVIRSLDSGGCPGPAPQGAA